MTSGNADDPETDLGCAEGCRSCNMRRMRFDLTDLRLFLTVIEAGSITHGAAGANLSLPSASERLRGMEEASGVMLLERGRRGVTPTEAGEALAHHARLILRQVDHMQGELGEFSKGAKATIRLLANTAAIAEFLPERLGPWLAAHPRIDVDLRERQSSDIVQAVTGGLAELGIVSDAVDPGVLQLEPFAIDRLVIVAPRGHPLTAFKRVAFSSVLKYKFVGLSADSALQAHIELQVARMAQKLKFRVRVRTFEGMCRMVSDDVGLAIMPEAAARRCRRALGIVAIRLEDAWATRQLSLCFRSEMELTPVARALMRHLGTGNRA
ncbi:DNA-binding transcriptional regulator, LysR family [Filomicrobium insigne]|uniref:DNA-binding transcriptional regulator, LysR family n=2 Tax=Hyphomicrobiaceae TaxID=45401 RepID=A0A1H0I875_9HYPH|nr:DNA-binding transcriptional regulator, LysR family [Filomicrobium insigne]